MKISKSKIQNPKLSFPRYPRYKDSGVEWLGDVPEHWEVSKTRWLWKEVEDPSENGDEQLLSISQYTGVTPTSAESRSESLVGYRRCKPDDLAMNIMLAWQGGLGISDYAGIVSPAYSVFRLRSDNNAHYLGYLYRTKRYLDEFGRHSTGIVPSRWRLYPDKFGHVLTLLPPKSEQDGIVAFLDQKTAEIDALIAKKQRQIELLDEQKAILINRAFSRICLTDVDVKFPTVGKLIQKQELTIQDGNHGELHPVSADYVDVGIPFLMASDVRPEEVNLATCAKLPEKKARKLRIGFALAGDVLLTHKATIGQVGKLPDVLDSPFVMLSPQTTYYRPLLGQINSEYLFQLLQTAYVQEQLAVLALNQSTRGYVGLIAQKRMILPIPSNQSQVRFESEARAIQEKTSSVRSRFKSQIEQLQSFRSTLIAHAVTGRIKV